MNPVHALYASNGISERKRTLPRKAIV